MKTTTPLSVSKIEIDFVNQTMTLWDFDEQVATYRPERTGFDIHIVPTTRSGTICSFLARIPCITEPASRRKSPAALVTVALRLAARWVRPRALPFQPAPIWLGQILSVTPVTPARTQAPNHPTRSTHVNDLSLS